MCIGDGLDTIGAGERARLRVAANQAFPRHMFTVEANPDGHVWVVLEPPARRADLLRFTICRIAPSLMVMVEDADGRRQFGSAADVECAMTFARNAAGRSVLAAINAHPPHEVMQ